MKRLTENAYGQMRTPPPSRNKSKNPSYESLYKRLVTIEDILGDEYDLERLRELAQADREGRCVVLPEGGCEDKDGENALKSAMHTCFYCNNPVTRFIADAVAEKLTRQEAQAALRREQE